jgi:hypothetical protein
MSCVHEAKTRAREWFGNAIRCFALSVCSGCPGDDVTAGVQVYTPTPPPQRRYNHVAFALKHLHLGRHLDIQGRLRKLHSVSAL